MFMVKSPHGKIIIVQSEQQVIQLVSSGWEQVSANVVADTSKIHDLIGAELAAIDKHTRLAELCNKTVPFYGEERKRLYAETRAVIGEIAGIHRQMDQIEADAWENGFWLSIPRKVKV